MRQKKAKLGLPEVIKKEVESHFKRDVLAMTTSMRDHHARLLRMFGTLKELVLPDKAAVDEITSSIFDNVGIEIIDVPFSLASAESSFRRLIDEVAPSETKEQFKDGVIWADCLDLLKTDDVFLITEDKAFYKERDHKQGISPTLAAELEGTSHKLTLLARLTDLLSEIKDSVPIDNMMLASAFLLAQRESVIGIVSRNDFELGEANSIQRRLYATENTRHLLLEFTIEYECPDLSRTRKPAVLKVEGECRYTVDTKTFDQFVTRGEELQFQLPDGTHTRRNVIIAVANMFIGHKNIENTVRVELE